MKLHIILHTHHSETVMAILGEATDLRLAAGRVTGSSQIDLYWQDDEQYRDWASWCAAALDCGLLYGARIERE